MFEFTTGYYLATGEEWKLISAATTARMMSLTILLLVTSHGLAYTETSWLENANNVYLLGTGKILENRALYQFLYQYQFLDPSWKLTLNTPTNKLIVIG